MSAYEVTQWGRSIRLPYLFSLVVQKSQVSMSLGPFSITAVNWLENASPNKRLGVSFHVELWPPAWG